MDAVASGGRRDPGKVETGFPIRITPKQNYRTKRSQRTAKSCGPGAATLALRRWIISSGNGGKKGRFPGESTKETVKPLRGESRDVSAVPVVQPVCFSVALFAHGTAGAVGARLSLRPLHKRGTTRLHNSGEYLPRECERTFFVMARSEADEAIHSAASGYVDCFASLAMTGMGCLTVESERRGAALHPLVMPGLVPGIHALLSCRAKDVDGRDKPGHDDGRCRRPRYFFTCA